MIKKDSFQSVFIRGFKSTTLFLLLFLFFICHAQQIPNRPYPPRLVNDYTNTLTAEEINNLEYKLISYNDTTSTQIAVVFINDLQGTTISDFAYQIGEKWGVGTKNNNGIVILVKPKNETKGEVFISVGYGLEAYIPDITAKIIIENEIIPEFKNNKYYSGINKAIDIIIGLASGAFSAEEYSNDNSEIFILIFFIIMMVIMITFINFAGKVGNTFSSKNDSSFVWRALFWASLFSNSNRHNRHDNWGGFSGGSGGFGGGGSFGGFGGGSFGGGGAGGSW